MYATIEKNILKISVAEFYNMAWYDSDQFLSRSEEYGIEYGHLEIDIHRNGRKYLTGFVIDPRKFIIDYLRTRYDKNFAPPKRVQSVSVETYEHVQLFCVDFLKARSFIINGTDKDLIFPHFCRRKGALKIQGFEVLDVFSLIKYLIERFGYKETKFIRQGNRAYDLKGNRWQKIRLGEIRKKTVTKKEKTGR